LSGLPDLTVVIGDVNSTIACALAAKKLGSRDWSMPEEINRMVTDAISDILWTPSPDADENLRNEGVAEDRIRRVGNIMIDSYEMMRPGIEAARTRDKFGLPAQGYGAVTLHRPGNVDAAETLGPLVDALIQIEARIPLVFAIHPRTRARLNEFGLTGKLDAAAGIHLTEPMGYVEFMGLVREARIIITDSGGIQEETTYLDIPCLTLRPNTERPITIDQGTNRLATAATVGGCVDEVLAGSWPSGRKPVLWGGKTATRIVADLG